MRPALSELRVQMGLTQLDAARRMGHSSQTAVSRIEAQSGPRFETLMAYLVALGLEPELTVLVDGKRISLELGE